ncbi:MAG: DUF3575 domain-containing protein [Bacteroidetes bacterium]|nr:DUF3575 domain-containing protein [Bacteroidota bacterium]
MLRKILVCLLLVPVATFAQDNYKNAIKFNTLGPVSQLYSAQYELAIGKHLAFNNTFFYRPKKLIPAGETIDNLAKKHGLGLTGIKFENIFMDEAKLGMKGYSPELRYYIGKKKNRLFVSAIGQYEDFDMTVPANLAVKYKTYATDIKVPVDFTFKTYSAGILIGKQFNWRRLGVDFVIIGPHFGKAKEFYAVAQNAALKQLNQEEKQYILDKIQERFGLSDTYFSRTLVDDKAEIKSIKPVPYLGIRGLGLNLFYRF